MTTLGLSWYIKQCRSRPFEWGVHDCARFAAGAVKAQTGIDLAEQVTSRLGSYSTPRQAARVLKAAGGMRAIGALAGEPEPPLCARFGDIGLIVEGHHELLAVCDGGRWLVVTRRGLGVVPFSVAIAAWRVEVRHG